MRYIGLDLALTTAHKAIVMDDRGQALTPVLKVHTTAAELEQLLVRAREGVAPDEPLSVVTEPTGMAWFPVAVFCQRHGVTIYVVNSQQVADLRRYYKRHAKSDRIDARVLAKLPVVSPDKLHPLVLNAADVLTCQRGCKELDRLLTLCTAIHYRVQAIDHFAWPGLETVFTEPLSPWARGFRTHWYDPRAVSAAGVRALEPAWEQAPEADKKGSEPAAWADTLVKLAGEVLAIYGSDGADLDYAALQAEVTREQTLLAELEVRHHILQLKTVRPRYRRLHPSRNLETLKGVGQDGAAVFVSFIGDPTRFTDHAAFRSWSGMIPNSRQSGESEGKGLHLSQAGPDLVKKFAFLDAETARPWDPQIAAIYCAQMMQQGKHHYQALCACAPIY